MVTNFDSDSSPLILEEEEEEEEKEKEKDEAPVPPQQIQFSIWNTFKQHIPRLLITILVDVILPFVVYLILRKRVKTVYAFLGAGIPPLIMVLIKGIISRTFDALGFLVFIAFAASGIAAIITHNPNIILLEKSLANGIISIIFAITLIPFSRCRCRCQIRPLAYYFYQDLVPTKRIHVGLPDILFKDKEESIELQEDGSIKELTHKQEVAQVYEWLYAHCPSFRHACYTITSIWSVGLFLEFLGRTFLILLHLSPDKIYIYGHIILITMTALLILLTILCITRERKKTLKLIENWKKEYLYNQTGLSNLNIVT